MEHFSQWKLRDAMSCRREEETKSYRRSPAESAVDYDTTIFSDNDKIISSAIFKITPCRIDNNSILTLDYKPKFARQM